jgi:hypothetical protein
MVPSNHDSPIYAPQVAGITHVSSCLDPYKYFCRTEFNVDYVYEPRRISVVEKGENFTPLQPEPDV